MRVKRDTIEKTFKYVTDNFGNIIEVKEIVDGALESRLKCSYDAWGNLTINSDYTVNVDGYSRPLSRLNPFYYRGYYYDVETQFYYLQTRYYDPALGRFINPDTIDYLDPESINGLNLYAYCNNNPIMYTDPTGHMPKWLKGTLKFLGAVGIVVGVTALTVFTAGAAAWVLGASTAMIGSVMSGAAIGGLVAGGLEIGMQLHKNGIDEMNLGAIAIESFVGSAYGAISGVASTTTSAALRLGMRGARVALGGLSTALHGFNDGDSFDEIIFKVGRSVLSGILIQGIFVGLDVYTGKLSNSTLQSYKLAGKLNFGANQILSIYGVLYAKSSWRNRGLFI